MNTRVSLSNRTFPLLRTFAQAEGRFRMSVEQAGKLDQRPFRALLVHGWIDFDPLRAGFYLTSAGWEAWDRFDHTSIERGESSLGKPLTRYFDATQYGIDWARRKKKKHNVVRLPHSA